MAHSIIGPNGGKPAVRSDRRTGLLFVEVIVGSVAADLGSVP